MGHLENGKWINDVVNVTDKKGRFNRQPMSFRDTISTESKKFQPEANRYHLYVSYACPWAHRTLIYRNLKELEPIISISVVNPYMGPNGWDFTEGEGVILDSINHCHYLREIYIKANAKFTGRVTVPILWDKKTKTIVNNESSEIIRIFNTSFNQITKNKLDFYPKTLQKEIDYWNYFIYNNINNGVYKVGFATNQEAYKENVINLFNSLDKIESHLKKQNFIIGNKITETDWRLFVTLIRFDAVYVQHFKCNIRQVKEYQNITNYLKKLYNHPKIKETVNIDHIKTHYFKSHPKINPSQIVPLGPENTLYL